ncbi:MAG: HipA domain-containing protein [Phycisphaerales bacterium]|nr:HipA domain-containing protein [Phycisphaerales bacterium]
MSDACRVCLAPVDGTAYHRACSLELFDAPTPPTIEVEVAKLHTLALAMVGHTSISGVQKKISLRLDSDRHTLQVATSGARYIFKPQAQTFPHLPENEHLTMRMAKLVGLEVPPCGLVQLADGSLAYLVRRFDRTATAKLALEDFCQLAEKSPKDKYEGSAELCFKLVARFASEPGIEKAKLLRLLMFTWWTGNGDMHLKNLSLLTRDGVHALSPVYDLLCTRLVIPGDQLALSVVGKKDRLGPAAWRALAEYAGVPPKAFARIAAAFTAALEPAAGLVGQSFLPAEMREEYVALLRERVKSFAS